MSQKDLKTLSNDDLKKCQMGQSNKGDWMDSCSKCGYPKLIHKNLHRDATCMEKQEALEASIEYWDKYKKRIKPVLKALKEKIKKDLQEGILLKGLKDFTEANTKATDKIMSQLLTILTKQSQNRS